MQILLALVAQQAEAHKQPHSNFFTILLGKFSYTIEQIIAPCKRAVLLLLLVFISLFITTEKPAYAQNAVLTPRQVVEYVLTLEKLEADFYRRAIDVTEKGSLASIPQEAKDAIASFEKDDTKHIDNLSAVLKNLGGNPDAITIPANPNYNAILGRNPFARPKDFLLAGQFLEDLGVAAYKGQVQNLLAAGKAAKPVLATALTIHSIEARHAAAIRFLRETVLGDDVRPWIRNPSEVIYKENRGGSPLSFYLEAFDGYATKDEVLTLLTPIIGTTEQRVPVRALW